MKLAKVACWCMFNAVRSIQRCARREEGGALVETALMMPVLVMMLVGTAEFGMAMYTAIEVSNAATAGIQYGAIEA